MMAAPLPSADELTRLANAALENAGGLIEDARILLTAKRWPRAFALAVLSAEEYGKFFLCVTSIPYAVSDEATRLAYQRKFWKHFLSHNLKNTAYAGQHVDSQDWGPVGSKGDAAWKKAWNERGNAVERDQDDKFAALYVDFAAGTVHTPAARITEHRAHQAVNQVSTMVSQAHGLFAGVDHAAHYEGNPAVRALFEAMINKDAAAMEAALSKFDQWLQATDRPEDASRTPDRE
jgi:AbiV family abortive infection protein